MDAEVTQQKIKIAIKHLLKKQNYTYADLAAVWGCSLPTVKRQLGPEELPMSRLLSLLEWLDISLSDLQKLVESDTLTRPRFTAKQNEFLAKNPLAFSFFMKLYEMASPEQIAKKYKIPKETVDKALIQLEKYDLIRVGSRGHVKPSYSTFPGADGALGLVYFRRVVDHLAQFYKNILAEKLSRPADTHDKKGFDSGLETQVYEVTEKTYQEYMERHRRLSEDFATATKLEDKTLKKSELKKAVLSTGFFLCDRDDPNLQLLENIMDDALVTAGR